MTLMEDLNKDPGPCWSRVWPQAFHMEERCSPNHTPPPSLPSSLLPSGCTCEVRGTGSSFSVPSQRGVCCSILMTKSGAGARSRYHTLICLKGAGLTIQSAGVHRNPVKARGLRQWQRTETTSLFVPETRAARFQSAAGLSPKPRIPSCISMGVFLHKEGGTAA